MTTFASYTEDIQFAINKVFYFKEERGQKYIKGLFSKFEYLRKEANDRLSKSIRSMYSQEVLQTLKPGKAILLPYLEGIIDEITRIASEETIRMREIENKSNIAEAMKQTFAKQYDDSGEIYRLIEEANNILAKAWRNYGCGNPNTDKGRQIAYEYNWFTKRLPKACWPPVLKLW